MEDRGSRAHTGEEPRVAELKAVLRSEMRAARDAIPAEERLRLGEEVAERLFGLPAVTGTGTVLLFYSFGSEVPTARIIQRLIDTGHRVLLPYLDSSKMEAAELGPGDSLVTTAYGAKEPAKRVPVEPSEVTTVVAPGLAFDPRGYRLGYGAGHYDRYLSRLSRRATRIGIGFHNQVVPAVPHGPADQRLDMVVTDRETIVCDPP